LTRCGGAFLARNEPNVRSSTGHPAAQCLTQAAPPIEQSPAGTRPDERDRV